MSHWPHSLLFRTSLSSVRLEYLIWQLVCNSYKLVWQLVLCSLVLLYLLCSSSSLVSYMTFWSVRLFLISNFNWSSCLIRLTSERIIIMNKVIYFITPCSDGNTLCTELQIGHLDWEFVCAALMHCGHDWFTQCHGRKASEMSFLSLAK